MPLADRQEDPENDEYDEQEEHPVHAAHSTYDAAMPEDLITPEDIERIRLGLELYSTARFDELKEFFTPDVVLTRISGPPLEGWDEMRAFWEPDAFESQRIEALNW